MTNSLPALDGTAQELRATLALQGHRGFACNSAGQVWPSERGGRTRGADRQYISPSPFLISVVKRVLKVRPEGARFLLTPHRLLLVRGKVELARIGVAHPRSAVSTIATLDVTSARQRMERLREAIDKMPSLEPNLLADALRDADRELLDLRLAVHDQDQALAASLVSIEKELVVAKFTFALAPAKGVL